MLKTVFNHYDTKRYYNNEAIAPPAMAYFLNITDTKRKFYDHRVYWPRQSGNCNGK
jgi:hypothetical protein